MVTYSLIAINVVVFVFQLFMDEGTMDVFIINYATIPYLISRGDNLISLVTSIFLHGGFGHILGNMLFLNIFGDNLEDKLGHLKYLMFYLLCGIAGSLAQIVLSLDSQIPMLGASGAIAGLMGGYLLLFPNHKVDILVPVFGFLETATVPAYTMLFYWIIFQIFGGIGSLGIDGGGVAYFAHIGGFLMGWILIKLLNPRNRSKLWRLD